LVALGIVWMRWSRIEVRTVKPVIGDAAQVVYATGAVEPRIWAKVSAPARKRILELCDCEGKRVTKGDFLARLDDVEERAVLSELTARRDRLNEDVERLRLLMERNAVSRTNYEDKLTQLREYEARVLAQHDRIADLLLKAPIDGVVLRSDAHVGEITGIGVNDVMFWVGQPRPLRINAEVNEEDIAKVRTGQVVLLRHDGFDGTTLSGAIEDVTPKGDPATKTFRAYVRLPDDTPLKIGMSVEANIVIKESKGVLLVPSEAVRDGAVMTVEENRLVRRPVTIGIRGTRMVEVTSGVDSSTVVVAPYGADLRPATRVRISSIPVARP
jgi:RND family efflux transporter MFP subunit